MRAATTSAAIGPTTEASRSETTSTACPTLRAKYSTVRATARRRSPGTRRACRARAVAVADGCEDALVRGHHRRGRLPRAHQHEQARHQATSGRSSPESQSTHEPRHQCGSCEVHVVVAARQPHDVEAAGRGRSGHVEPPRRARCAPRRSRRAAASAPPGRAAARVGRWSKRCSMMLRWRSRVRMARTRPSASAVRFPSCASRGPLRPAGGAGADPGHEVLPAQVVERWWGERRPARGDVREAVGERRSAHRRHPTTPETTSGRLARARGRRCHPRTARRRRAARGRSPRRPGRGPPRSVGTRGHRSRRSVRARAGRPRRCGARRRRACARRRPRAARSTTARGRGGRCDRPARRARAGAHGRAARCRRRCAHVRRPVPARVAPSTTGAPPHGDVADLQATWPRGRDPPMTAPEPTRPRMGAATPMGAVTPAERR
jgi:hypothetical protein